MPKVIDKQFKVVWVWHMFDTYFGAVEHNYNILNIIEGHLRPINAIPRSFQGQALKLSLYRSVTHVA